MTLPGVVDTIAYDVSSLTASYITFQTSQGLHLQQHSRSQNVPSAENDIVGQFQLLKTIKHPNLCQYIEIIKGKHGRLFIVSEHHESLHLQTVASKSLDEQRAYIRDFAVGLSHLHERRIVVGDLQPKKLVQTQQGKVKLQNYGLMHITFGMQQVDFSIGNPRYLAPESLVDQQIISSKSDIWSFGLIVMEWHLGHQFWSCNQQDEIISAVRSLNDLAEQEDGDVWSLDEVQNLPITRQALQILRGQDELSDEEASLYALLRQCLQLRPEDRIPSNKLWLQPFLFTASDTDTHWVPFPATISRSIQDDVDLSLDATEDEVLESNSASYPKAFYLWQLAGGDVEADAYKRGVVPATASIEKLPRLVRLNDIQYLGMGWVDRGPALHDDPIILDMAEVERRLLTNDTAQASSFNPDMDYFMIPEENDINFIAKQELIVSPAEKSRNLTTDGVETVDADNLADGVDEISSLTLYDDNVSSSSQLEPSSKSEMDSDQASIAPSVSSRSSATAPRLPLFLRERDVAYQLRRFNLYRSLLSEYPASRDEIIQHAKIDISPMLRGSVWAAIIGVNGDPAATYDAIDKESPDAIDRQIDVDVPRCHQYNPLLASSAGHQKLRRLLKAWVVSNPHLVYWQGLDSLCAPFLALNFNDEALAFASLQLFVPRFLSNFFLPDNAPVIQEFLAVFRHLLSFHDPDLSTHLDLIGFNPELYAIPWFLTLFTHVFPLHRIYHLWDKLLVGPSSLPLFAGIAILRQIRDLILGSEFNDCIVLFSEGFPEVDIERCVSSAISMCKLTPTSLLYRVYDDTAMSQRNRATGSAYDQPEEADANDAHWWKQPISLEQKKKELAPRVSLEDFVVVQPAAVVLDVRSQEEFNRGHLPSSINVQPSQLPHYAPFLKKMGKKYHVVLSDRNDDGPEFAGELVRSSLPRVMYLNGGMDVIRTSNEGNAIPTCTLCTCRPLRQTTPKHRGKGSEPPFTMWKCKTPIPTAQPST